MSQENRINDALKQLGEEYRLGMVSAEEFRGRRRALLQSWGDRDATTSPSALPRKASTTQVNPDRGKGGPGAMPSPLQGKSGKGLLAGGLVLLLAAGVGAYFVFKKRPSATAASSTAAAPIIKRSPELLAVMRAATEFRSRNRWEAEDTDGFLSLWRALTPSDQVIARQEPSLQSLRYELEQNIQAEAQAMATPAGVAPSANDTPPASAQQERLDRLRAFALALTGSEP